MAEKRFSNSEEIAALRDKGIVAVSPFVCRLCASISFLFFLYNEQVLHKTGSLLTTSSISSDSLLPELLLVLRSLVIASILYLFTFAATALLQSHFYFRPGLLFHRQGLFFAPMRGLSFFRASAVLFILAILGFCGIVFYLWKEFFLSQLGLITATSSSQMFNVLVSSSKKLSFILAIILLISIVLAFLYKKISFIFSNRIAVRPR